MSGVFKAVLLIKTAILKELQIKSFPQTDSDRIECVFIKRVKISFPQDKFWFKERNQAGNNYQGAQHVKN